MEVVYFAEMLAIAKLLIFLCCPSICLSRIHSLALKADDRSQIALSTFGFYKEGSLDVKVTSFSYWKLDEDTEAKSGEKLRFGFTIDKTVSGGISPEFENHPDKCVFSEKKEHKKDNPVSLILMELSNLNSKDPTLQITRTGDLNETSINSEPLVRQKREAGEKPGGGAAEADPVTEKKSGVASIPDGEATSGGKKESSPASDSASHTEKKESSQASGSGSLPEKKKGAIATAAQPKSSTTSTAKPSGEEKESEVPAEIAVVKSDLLLEVPVVKNNSVFALQFSLSVEKDREEGLYNLYFHRCPQTPEDGSESAFLFNMSIEITEMNADKNYLSAGEMALPTLYFAMSAAFFLAASIFFSVLRANKEDIFKIHYLMLALAYTKSLSLLFHGINYHYIKKYGFHIEAWAVLFYVTHLLKGVILFITIVLIGTGYAFVKSILSDRDKKLFMIIIPLQLLANIAQIIIEESDEGESQYDTWKEVFILVDLLCCGAILFPVIWSIRHLQEASETDGKAAISLAKLKLFRHFYIMIVCYIYFTRIIVYLLKITVPFQYEWFDELFGETATLVFFIVTGYKFRPKSSNPYLKLPQEEELEMDEVCTPSGALQNVTKVGKNKDGVSKRESSHEYD